MGRYRNAQPLLFQGSAWQVQRARIQGGLDRVVNWGPNAQHVCVQSGWPWDRVGGDWIDADGTRWGTKPWASVDTAQGPISLVADYSMDLTALVLKAQADKRWLAMRLKATKAQRQIATRWANRPPVLSVSYVDGTSEDLAPTITAAADTTGTPDQTALTLWLPAFVEFARPEKPVTAATLKFTVVQHPNGTATPIQAMLLDPPLNSDPVQFGVASQAGPLDAGIETAPGVIGAHRYADNAPLEKYLLGGPAVNTWASREFSPELWGGQADTSKLPYRGAGKFVVTNLHGPTLVDSTYDKEGFKALAPGLAALRLWMPAEAKADGARVGYGGTGGANASIFMPPEEYGRLGHIFTRAYYRIGTPDGGPLVRDPVRTLQVYRSAGTDAAEWVDNGGKWGVMPDHTSSFGGTSGSAGGGRGWQMRLGWQECDGYCGGPMEGGWRPSFHLYDFGVYNPRGPTPETEKAYDYSGDVASKAHWGQRGGLGGMLYAHQWYCVETELKLNTVMDDTPGFLPDGELRAWIDGRLVFERKGMVFRSKPIYSPALDAATMAGVRDLGVRALWNNWYHGGVVQSSHERVMFVASLVWGTQYIGPMKGI